MGRYDDAMKALCSVSAASMCRWLGVPVGDGVDVMRHSESVSAATRMIDALVITGERTAVHLEFQSGGEAHFACRMLEYLLRLVRLPELEDLAVAQHVIMLGPGRVDEGLHLPGLDYEITVHYLRDQPPEPLLADPSLAPFAPLADLADEHDRYVTTRRALDLVAGVADDTTRRVLAQATVDLAGIYLPADIISKAWEESSMPVPSLCQQIHDESLAEGRELVIAELIAHRFGADGRIGGIARRLAGDERYLQRIDAARSLDDLA